MSSVRQLNPATRRSDIVFSRCCLKQNLLTNVHVTVQIVIGLRGIASPTCTCHAILSKSPSSGLWGLVGCEGHLFEPNDHGFPPAKEGGRENHLRAPRETDSQDWATEKHEADGSLELGSLNSVFFTRMKLTHLIVRCN